MQIGENQKHVVALLGSPRKKGNSTVLAEQIIVLIGWVDLLRSAL